MASGKIITRRVAILGWTRQSTVAVLLGRRRDRSMPRGGVQPATGLLDICEPLGWLPLSSAALRAARTAGGTRNENKIRVLAASVPLAPSIFRGSPWLAGRISRRAPRAWDHCAIHTERKHRARRRTAVHRP